MGDKLEGQRRQVTVVFVDMVGYTTISERLGEEATYGLMQAVLEPITRAVQEHGGKVQTYTGDGIMALFGTPIGLEEAPLCACKAALAIQEKIGRIGDEIESVHGARPILRIGINTGPVVIGKVGTGSDVEFTPLGDAVNVAARLVAEAERGTILIGEATWKLVDGRVEAQFAGERQLKGKAQAQRVYRLDSLKGGITRFEASVRRGLVRFIGRLEELDSLFNAWESAKRGTTHIANVMGEAGIGKTRLIHEFRQRIASDQEELFILHGECTASSQTTPFGPFIEVVQESFRIASDASAEEAERRLRSGFEILGIDADVNLPFLLNILGHGGAEVERLEPEVVGIQTRAALQCLLRERCRLSRVVLFIDDLHWIDSASEQLLKTVAECADSLSMLIVCAFRPEYEAPWSGVGVTEVHLTPLPNNGVIDLLTDWLDTTAHSTDLLRLIVTKSEGNPLFAEELARYVLEHGGFDSTRSQTFESDGFELPVSLENLLLTRVDRLAVGPRSVLQTASIIGHRFSSDLLETVSVTRESIRGDLKVLERQELIVTDTNVSGTDYAFKHVLLQNAVYATLLGQARQELHERVGQEIEAKNRGRLDEFADTLAYHYSHTPRTEKAVLYMALAGDKAHRVFSLEEADIRYRQVFELIESVPGCADESFLADVLEKWLSVMTWRSEFKTVIETAEKYLPRIEALGETRPLSKILSSLGSAYMNTERFKDSQRVHKRALAIGESLDDEECIAYACVGLMWHYNLSNEGEPKDIVTQFGNRVLSMRAELVEANTIRLTMLSLNCIGRSLLSDAKKYALQNIELGRTADYPGAIGLGFGFLAWADVLGGNYEEALEHANAALNATRTPVSRINATAVKGVALALSGNAQEGCEMLREVRCEVFEGGFLGLLTGIEIPYGASMVLAGQMAAGTRCIEDAIARFTRWGAINTSAWGHAILGEIYAQMAIGAEPPPVRVILKNIWFVIRTMPVAARKSRQHCQEAIRLGRKSESMGHVAQSLLNLGLLAQKKRQNHCAREYFEKAQEAARPLGWPLLEQKIEAALNEL